MSQGWQNRLWIALFCLSFGCSQTADNSSSSSGGGKSDPQIALTGGSKDSDLPPEPEDDSGSARVSDKSGKARTKKLSDEDNPFQDEAVSTKSPVEKGAARKSLNGKWVLVLTRPGDGNFVDFHTGLIDIDSADEAAPAKWSGPSGVLPPTELKSSEVKGSQIQLTFDVSGTTLDFRGKLKDGVVYGNAQFGNCLPARLEPTKVEALDDYNCNPPPANSRELQQAFNLEDRKAAIKSMRKFVADHAESPLVMMAWESLILVSAAENVSADSLQKSIDDYLAAIVQWGPRLQQVAQGNVAMILAQTRFDPEFSLKYVALADKALTDESLKDLKEQLKAAREGIQTVQALKLIESDDADRAKKAFDFLTKLRTKSPFDPSLIYGLARYQEKAKQTDAALELYAELSTLPQMEGFLAQIQRQQGNEKPELASETLATLWEKAKGSTDGLDDFKDSIYRRRLVSFAEKSTEAPAEGGRLVLCELFTGASCPPCVAADVATAGLEKTYPKSQVVVIRYHQHIPGPDPLTIGDGEDRFSNYYRGQGTPLVLLNGAPVSNTGGYMPNAPEIYRGLKTLIDARLADAKTTVKVRLKAQVDDGLLRIASDVQGLEDFKDDELEDLKLRVVIAEDEVHFAARNGVRHHEMIVRRMIGGPDGVSVKDGKLSTSASIPLEDLKASIETYLKKYEESEAIDFPAKPIELRNLHVIAFVQNDGSKEVLQTNSVAVKAGSATGNGVTPTAGKTTPRTSSKKKTDIE